MRIVHGLALPFDPFTRSSPVSSLLEIRSIVGTLVRIIYLSDIIVSLSLVLFRRMGDVLRRCTDKPICIS